MVLPKTIAFCVLSISAVVACQAMPPEQSAFDTMYARLMSLKPDQWSVAPVRNLILQRDVGTFRFLTGTMALCTCTDRQVRGAVFEGRGFFSFVPPTDVERQQLVRFFEKDSVVQEFRTVFMLFADSTREELARALPFTYANVPRNAIEAVVFGIGHLSDADHRYFDTDIMKTFLDGGRNGLFCAQIGLVDGDRYRFEIDPFEQEEVSFMRLYEKRSHSWYDLISNFHLASDGISGQARSDTDTRAINLKSYTIASTIADDLDFAAVCGIAFTARQDQLQDVYFLLDGDLHADSVFILAGKQIPFARGEKNSVLWIHLPAALARGEACSLRVCYHGDLLEKDENGWITIKSPDYWYPRYGYHSKPTYDLTFTYPSRFKFASVGEKVSEHSGGDAATSRYLLLSPAHNASFNIGLFKDFSYDDPRIPKVTAYMAEGGHRAIANELFKKGITSGADMEATVGADIVNSLSFFQSLYGKLPLTHMYATEIPQEHGEAFPGIIHLSWVTYQNNESDGSSEVFRAHEVAHQWWGIGVGFKTYHDQWLSEGFSDYSGLLYLQAVLKNNQKFFGLLDAWKEMILSNRKFLFGSGQEAGPISLGYRTSSTNTPGDYDLIIYKKGAWVLHMLRNMFLDLTTMSDDAFNDMLRDFFATYYGSEASTEDFQRTVEKHIGMDMGWFFRQWVYDTRIPKYTFSYKTENTPDGKTKLLCRVKQENVPKTFRMAVPLLLKFPGDRFARIRMDVSGEKAQAEFLLPLEPQEVIFNDLHSVLCEQTEEGWQE